MGLWNVATRGKHSAAVVGSHEAKRHRTLGARTQTGESKRRRVEEWMKRQQIVKQRKDESVATLVVGLFGFVFCFPSGQTTGDAPIAFAY